MSLESAVPLPLEPRARLPAPAAKCQREAGGTFVTGQERTGLSSRFGCDVVIIGGCGHVGLPLAVAFAERGPRVASYDIGAEAVEAADYRRLPFRGPAAGRPLRRAVRARPPGAGGDRGG